MTKWIWPTYPQRDPGSNPGLCHKWKWVGGFQNCLEKNCMVVLSLSPFLFILPCLAIRKKCFNASPWTYSVLPTLEMAADTSCLSPPCTWNFFMWSKILCCRKSNCQSTKWLWNPNTASGVVFHHLWYYPGPHETLLTAILGRHPLWRLSSW